MSAASTIMASPWRALDLARRRAQPRHSSRAAPAAAGPLRRRRPPVASSSAAAAPEKNSQAAADQFFSANDREASKAFEQLLREAGGTASVELRPSGAGGGGRGLFFVGGDKGGAATTTIAAASATAASAASPGNVLLRVPFSACLSVAYAAGGDGRISTPQIRGDQQNGGGGSASWPRLVSGVRRAALAAEAAAEEAALAAAADEDDGGRPMSSSSGAADEAEALTWDVLLALGVMDALAGDGGDWWARYSAALFPAPEAVPLPMCWRAPLLDALRHASVAEAARAQQLRLRMLYAPFCAAPAVQGAPNGGAPSYMEWAFACVRSRACRLTERPLEAGGGGGGGSNNGSGSSSSAAATFALVPFLDCANHSDRPNAAYRLVESGEEGEEGDSRNNNGGGSENGASSGAARPSSPSPWVVELVAVSDVRPGDEVCISYTGPPPAPATNRLLMAQYGFVPAGGNPCDRYEELAFGAFSLRDPKNKGGAAAAAGAAAADGKTAAATTVAASGFRLRAVQGAVGDEFFLRALKGEDPYGYAALKSLPLARDDADAAAAASAAGLPLRPEVGGGGGGAEGDPCPPDAAERALAERLLDTLNSGPLPELRAGAAGVREALAEDEALVSRLEAAGAAAAASAGAARAASLSADEADPRFAAAVRYRVERARLVLAVERVLLALAAA